MKIAMVFEALGIGGIERVGASYAQLLVDAGHEVTVINLQSEKDEMFAQFPDACAYRTDKLGILFQPDVFAVLLKRPWGKYVYPLAYLGSRLLLGVKKIFSRLKDREAFDVAIAFSGHVTDLTYVAYDLVKGSKKLTWAHEAIEDHLFLSYGFLFLYEKVRNICVPTTHDLSKMLGYFPRLQRALNIYRVYNPVAQTAGVVDESKRALIQGEWGEPIVMVGRIDVDKDQATVIRALALLRDEFGLKPHLIFVGDGPQRASCEELIKELGLTSTVHFVGSQSDVDTYYLSSKLAVHSSPAEGFGLVLLEAMRDDVAVLATNSLPGVPEILGDSEYGMICKVGDPEDMAEKMYELLTDDELRQSFAEKGKQRVADFSPEVIGQQLEEILRTLT